MGKMCWINGQPYSVGLPTGGKSKTDCKNQWDDFIAFLGGDCNELHWYQQYSLCQELIKGPFRPIRGHFSAKFWNYLSVTSYAPNAGFRPVFTPLDSQTLKPDLSLLEDIQDGERFALASLYIDGEPVDLSGNHGPKYNSSDNIVLGDRDANKNNWLYVIKYKDLLWTDRNILTHISWSDLKIEGFAD